MVFVNNVYFLPFGVNPLYVDLLSLCSSFIKYNVYSSENGGIKLLYTFNTNHIRNLVTKHYERILMSGLQERFVICQLAIVIIRVISMKKMLLLNRT